MWADNGGAFLPIGFDKLSCPSVALIGDTHTGQMDWRIDYAKMFSHVYLMFTRHHIPEFEQAGVTNIGWLPAACDPRFHGKFDVAKSYEIGFIGQTNPQWHPDRVALLERLRAAGFDLQVDGKILEEMSLFHSRSKIVFNRSLNLDLNRRVFEALCSGSMLLTDRLPAESGLESLFVSREHLVLYNDDEVEELARYYVDHDEEREAIAAAGRKLAMAEHTYAVRANQLLSDVIGSTAAQCVDPGTLEAGDSSPVDAAQVLSSRPSTSPLDVAITELSDYTGESTDTIRAQMHTSGTDLATEWRSSGRDTAGQIDDFYKQTDCYLYNLTKFNYGEMYQGWRGAIKNVCYQVSEAVGDRGFDVLDYGAGIGTNLIDVAGVPGIRLHYADLPGKTFEYAQWRFAQRGLSVNALSAEGADPLKGRTFDVIFCMDVIEHLV
ncbi:TPA: hypothetical protein DCE37_01155, partial [Candidatus Latescibacteria bacterium]|nr:hypothetical protein [Candidatus Latescibacterota bacterium]